jgi:hypothetical protein
VKGMNFYLKWMLSFCFILILGSCAQSSLNNNRRKSLIVDKEKAKPINKSIWGGIDPQVIRYHISRNIPSFKLCYEEVVVRRKSNLEVAVELQFTIETTGKVKNAKIDTFSNKLPLKVSKCLISVLEEIQFPEPASEGSVEVVQPMNLHIGS